MAEAENGVSKDTEEEPKPGLLELSVLRDGKRERKKTDRLEFASPEGGEKKMFEMPQGSGVHLGGCPIIEHNLQNFKSEDLKPLHKLLFKTLGQVATIKKNIRKFNGFSFESGTPDYEKKLQQLNKIVINDLKKMCQLFDIERTGTKEEICKRILDFLMKPEPSNKQVPEKKKAQKRTSKSTEGTTEKKKKKANENTDEQTTSTNDNEQEATLSLVEEKQGEETASEKQKDLSDKPIKKKTKKSETKGKEKKAAKLKTKIEGKLKSPKTPKKKTSPKKKEEQLISSADISPTDSESDNEPLAAMKKPKFPSDDEIAAKVKEILDGADLDKVTMKIVCREVYAKYPELDLMSKKDFIKTTVKKIIS